MGHVEILSTEFALGWAAASPEGRFAELYAVLGTEVIGASTAHFGRADLDTARVEGSLNAYAFLIVFNRPVATEDVARIQIMPALGKAPLPPAGALKLDRTPPLRVFVLGSPRSGTSEMGTTLAAALKLPWLGEGHAAPLFATAANALQGDGASSNGFVRFLAREHYRKVAVDAAREAYFFIHASASFLDKTPGAPMVSAVPFLHECFPDARFIFLWRHPVGNVLSRMAKFGGNIESHSRDWAASMNAWRDVRKTLPHYLEIRQEDMMARPHAVAAEIARYVGVPDIGGTIGTSLAAGTRERTGAGLGKTTTAEANWTPEQVAAFSRICSPVLAAFEAENTAAAADIAV
jgi:hypothetical protein